MEARISGDGLPVVTLKLNRGETVISENGGMSWMDPRIKMQTTTNGGIMKGLGRALSGESLFMNSFTAEDDDVEVAFASSFPGKILEVNLGPGESIIAQKRAFLCGESSVEMKMHFRKKLGAGLFGGEGLFVTTLTGPGTVWLQSMPVSNLVGLIAAGMPQK